MTTYATGSVYRIYCRRTLTRPGTSMHRASSLKWMRSCSGVATCSLCAKGKCSSAASTKAAPRRKASAPHCRCLAVRTDRSLRFFGSCSCALTSLRGVLHRGTKRFFMLKHPDLYIFYYRASVQHRLEFRTNPPSRAPQSSVLRLFQTHGASETGLSTANEKGHSRFQIASARWFLLFVSSVWVTSGV